MSSKSKKEKKQRSKVASRKAKKLSKSVALVSAISKSMLHDNIDVKELEDVAKLVEHIKNNVVTLLLIYADWCGHCKTFKTDIWEKLASLKGRKLSMAQLNETQLANFPGVKADGFPTVVLMGSDMKPATLTDPTSGEPTNSLPNTRDMDVMTTLVSANPSQVLANNGMSAIEDDTPRSAMPIEESAKARKKAGEKALESIDEDDEESKTAKNPPNIEDDLIATSTPPSMESANTPRKAPSVGGSLYASLVEATKLVAVPALLTTAVALKTRRVRFQTKGTKKLRKRKV